MSFPERSNQLGKEGSGGYGLRIKLCMYRVCTTDNKLEFGFNGLYNKNNVLLTQLSRLSLKCPFHLFNGAPKLFEMQSILCVSCVCSLMYTSSTCVQIVSEFERAVLKLYIMFLAS